MNNNKSKKNVTQEAEGIASFQGIEDDPGALFIGQQVQGTPEDTMSDEEVQALKLTKTFDNNSSVKRFCIF